jgi:hypothetical protein
MRIQEILESTFSIKALVPGMNAQELKDYIQTNCKEYLSQVNPATDIMYRGMRLSGHSAYLDAFELPVPGTSTKHDVDVNIQEIANKVIRKLGLTVNRFNSRYATGNPNQAKHYGTVFVAIPKGPFDFTWNPKIEDLKKHEADGAANIKELSKSYVDTDIKSAINSNNEIMLRCHEILVDVNIYKEMFGA